MTKEIELQEVSAEQIALTYFKQVILNEREIRSIYNSCKDWENNQADHSGEHVQTSGTYSYEYFISNIYFFENDILEYVENKY